MTQARQFNEWEFRGRPPMFAVVVDDMRLQTSNKAKPSGTKRLEVKRLRELPEDADRLEWQKIGGVSRAAYQGGFLIRNNSGALAFIPPSK